jgi:hypothetical protein
VSGKLTLFHTAVRAFLLERFGENPEKGTDFVIYDGVFL